MGFELQFEQLLEFLANYIPYLFRTISIKPDVNLFKPSGRGRNRKLDRNLIFFVGLNIILGLLLQSFIPNRPPLNSLLKVIGAIFSIWLLYSATIYGIFSSVGGKKDIHWSATVCLQILSASYFVSSLFAFLFGILWLSIGSDLNIDPILSFFIVELVLLFILLPRSLNKVHFQSSSNKILSLFRSMIIGVTIVGFTAFSFLIYGQTNIAVSDNEKEVNEFLGAGNVDLEVGVPQLVSTPPIIAYQPLEFSVAITNTGNMALNQQFFVDLYLDPDSNGTEHITLSESDGYRAVSGLLVGESQTITITASFGFTNTPTEHFVYAMVDSVEQVNEMNEENNVSLPWIADQVATVSAPTPTSEIISAENSIRGNTNYVVEDETKPLLRAIVTLTDESNNQEIAITTSDIENSEFLFNSVVPGSYTISVCGNVDNIQYFGVQTGIRVPLEIDLLITATSSESCE